MMSPGDRVQSCGDGRNAGERSTDQGPEGGEEVVRDLEGGEEVVRELEGDWRRRGGLAGTWARMVLRGRWVVSPSPVLMVLRTARSRESGPPAVWRLSSCSPVLGSILSTTCPPA